MSSVNPDFQPGYNAHNPVQPTKDQPLGHNNMQTQWYNRATLPRRIGVVIPTRNRATRLAGMLGSLRVQSIKPERILVVDDGDQDETETIVKDFPGVEYLRASVGEGKSGNPARNVGFRKLVDMPYLCFVDDDDMVPPDYLEQLVVALESDCRAAAAYPRLLFCGTANHRWQVNWDPMLLGRTNISGVPALIRTDALRQVGGWPEFQASADGLLPQDDWALWRRIRDHGWTMVPTDVEYFYHRHDNVLSHSFNHAWAKSIDRENLVTVAIPWSGRDYTVDDLLHAIQSQTFPIEKLHLLFYDNSGNAAFGRRLKSFLFSADEFCGQTYIKDFRPPIDECSTSEIADGPLDECGLGGKQFGQQINDRVGAIWNRIGRLVNTDLIWCLEDDVIPPPDTLKSLFEHMEGNVDAVTACYPARNAQNSFAIWHYTSPDDWVRLLPRGKGVEKVDGCGLGCALVRRDVFLAGPARSAGEAVGYDCNMWLDLKKRGGTVLADWSLLCEHRVRFTKK